MKRIFALCVIVLALGCGGDNPKSPIDEIAEDTEAVAEKLQGTWLYAGGDGSITLRFIVTGVHLYVSNPEQWLVGQILVQDDVLTFVWTGGYQTRLEFSINGDQLTLTKIDGEYLSETRNGTVFTRQ